jgi:hypothetical protein
MSSRYPAPRLAARARGPALALGYGDIKGPPTSPIRLMGWVDKDLQEKTPRVR